MIETKSKLNELSNKLNTIDLMHIASILNDQFRDHFKGQPFPPCSVIINHYLIFPSESSVKNERRLRLKVIWSPEPEIDMWGFEILRVRELNTDNENLLYREIEKHENFNYNLN